MTGADPSESRRTDAGEVAVTIPICVANVMGLSFYKNGELSDSCWGFMGNFSDVLKDMAEYLPDECERDGRSSGGTGTPGYDHQDAFSETC